MNLHNSSTTRKYASEQGKRRLRHLESRVRPRCVAGGTKYHAAPKRALERLRIARKRGDMGRVRASVDHGRRHAGRVDRVQDVGETGARAASRRTKKAPELLGGRDGQSSVSGGRAQNARIASSSSRMRSRASR